MIQTSSIAPVVILPRMGAAEAITVSLALMTALRARNNTRAHAPPRARAERDAPPVQAAVPSTVTSAAKRLDRAEKRLSSSCARSVKRATARSSATARCATRRERFWACKRAWAALKGQLRAWRDAKVFDALSPAQRAAVERVFPGGASIDVNGRTRAVWGLSAAKLAQFDASGLGEVFDALGGALIVSHVRSEHAALGAVLGVSVPLPSSDAAAEASDVLDALARTLDAMRSYVLAVYGAVDPDVPTTEELAGALLAPLLEAAAQRRKTAARAKTPKVQRAATPVMQVPANDVAQQRQNQVNGSSGRTNGYCAKSYP